MTVTARRHGPAGPLRKSGLEARVAWPVVGLLTATSLFLGFYDLDRRSLWLDEGYTWLTSAQSVHTIFSIARQQGYHLLPYYLLIHSTMSVFGDSPFALRAPSVIAGALSVPLLYLLVARLGGRLAGVYASILLVVSEPLVFWQQNARDYAIVVLLSVASCLAAVVALQEERLWRFVVWGVVTGLGCYTHPEMLLVLPPQLLVLLVWSRTWRIRLKFLAITAVGALASLPVLGEAAHSSVYQTTSLLPPNLGSAIGIATFLSSASGNPSAHVNSANHALLGITVGVVVVGLGMLGADMVVRGRTPFNLGLAFTITWLVLPPILSWIVSELGHPSFLDRYLILSLPAASAAVALVVTRVEPRALGLFAVAYLTIFRAGFLIPSYHLGLDDYRDATRTVLVSARPGDCITFSSNQGRMLWDYYSARMQKEAGGRLHVPTQHMPYATNGGPLLVLHYNDVTDGQITAFQAPFFVAEASVICPRLWLFQSHSGNPGGSPESRALYRSLTALRANLLAWYQPVRGVPFPGVGVFLYDRVRVAQLHRP